MQMNNGILECEDVGSNEMLVIRLNFMESILEYVYKKKGYRSIPFDVEHKMALIDDCSRDIYYFFMYVLDSAELAHRALGLLKKSCGNVYLFYLLLQSNQQEKFKKFCLFDYTKFCPDIVE